MNPSWQHENRSPGTGMILAVRAVLVGYAQIFFGTRPLSGLIYLAATFVVPLHGVSGLLALLFADGWAFVFGRPRKHIAEGYYAFNGLLVGLALGLFFRFSIPFVLLLAISSLLTTLIAAGLRNLAERYLGLPVLSLAFVLVTWIALLATRRFAGVEYTIETVLASSLGAGWLPGWFELYLRSLGAAFFQLSVLSGALVLVGLIVFSRWAVVLSVIGFGSGWGVYAALGGAQADLAREFIGFNFILTAIAVGGIWVVLKPVSMLMAALAGAISSLLAAAALALLKPLGLPVLAMPFIAATQMILFVLYIRTRTDWLKVVRGTPDSPERNLSRAVYRARRYPEPGVPVFYLPVMGRWLVTQGPDGQTTHQGLWAHAWDFEAGDDQGEVFQNQGRQTSDYFAWGKPVLAPAEGKVVRVIQHLADNPIGEMDTVNNWGNLVILWHGGDVYSALCHLAQKSVVVSEDDRVSNGQIIGKVGNSGRSPVPHLHMQIQSAPEIGAPTRYAEFIHYQVSDPNAEQSQQYITHGKPEAGQVVARMEVDESVRAAVSLAPGRQWHWVIEQDGRSREEHWESEIDPVGQRRLVDRSGRASLGMFVDDHYTTLLDYDGPADHLLGLLYLGMPRLPYVKERRLVWWDHPSLAPFLLPIGRMLNDFLLPFVELNRVRTDSHLVADSTPSAPVKLLTRLQVDAGPGMGNRMPELIEVEFSPGVGPVAIDAFRAGEKILSAKVQS